MQKIKSLNQEAVLGDYHRQTDRPTNHPTEGHAGSQGSYLSSILFSLLCIKPQDEFTSQRTLS